MKIIGDSARETHRRQNKPRWLKASIPGGREFTRIQRALDQRGLHTICRSARCPNIGECWNHGHATFLIMGEHCTRDCHFCAVPHGSPRPLDPDEPAKLVETARVMNLRYAVITSVTRDDLSDGGSSHFVRVISTLKREIPDLLVEVLIPDFSGDEAALNRVLDSQPHVLNHNIETVRSQYRRVGRPLEQYERSLMLLQRATNRGAITKSGIMVGLGETRTELRHLFCELFNRGVSLLTIGQYCQPTTSSVPVERYYAPEEFGELESEALKMGFSAVASGPLVRSSYNARELYETHRDGKKPPIKNGGG
ncbi:MAG TPA: lipoyl synthase [Candidatus Aminicenantes bacterium]|nr:lipoyl synthase [Candidatus Aminicenantes bacterium]